jgi:hypothetical protein
MPELTLINLSAQRDAVAKYVEGWETNEILNWMREYGNVIEPQENDPNKLYTFESQTGFKDVFYFEEEDNKLIVLDSGWLR